METSLPTARSSTTKYNLRRSLKRKWACACCIGKDNFDQCKNLVKLEKSKKKSTQPLLNEEEKVPELTDAAKMYMKLSKETIGIQIPESYAKLIKPENNLKICTVNVYQLQVYPTFENFKDEAKENIEEHFLEFKKDCINKLTMSNIKLCVPKSIINDYITDGELPLSILRPCGEATIYDVVCKFFEENKRILNFQQNIKAVILDSFEFTFHKKLLFKNQSEEMEYEKTYDEYFKGLYCSTQLGLRFLLRFILNLPKWNILDIFHQNTKFDFMFCINLLMRYIAENGYQDPTINQYKKTQS